MLHLSHGAFRDSRRAQGGHDAPGAGAGRLRDSGGEVLVSAAEGVVVKDGRLVPKWPENMARRSQGLEPLYHDCGQFYCLNVESFQRQKKIWMENAVPFIQDEMYVQDIDTLEDWEIAEMKYKLMCCGHGAGEQGGMPWTVF